MMAWKEEKGMGNEGRKGNGWSHCSQKVILERALRARCQVSSALESALSKCLDVRILGQETSVMPLPGS